MYMYVLIVSVKKKTRVTDGCTLIYYYILKLKNVKICKEKESKYQKVWCQRCFLPNIYSAYFFPKRKKKKMENLGKLFLLNPAALNAAFVLSFSHLVHCPVPTHAALLPSLPPSLCLSLILKAQKHYLILRSHSLLLTL